MLVRCSCTTLCEHYGLQLYHEEGALHCGLAVAPWTVSLGGCLHVLLHLTCTKYTRPVSGTHPATLLAWQHHCRTLAHRAPLLPFHKLTCIAYA